MARLIDADNLLELFYVASAGQDEEFVKTVEMVVDETPTVDAVEVKHGRWFLLDECSNEGVYCSVCHKKVYRKEYANQKLKSNFCPNCGANMKDGDGDA